MARIKKDATAEDRMVYDFLYGMTPLGGMPDSTLRVGVEFEVAGAYEDWGFVVTRLQYIEGSPIHKPTYTEQKIATGRSLNEAIASARTYLQEEHAKSDSEKCQCGNAMAIYKKEEGINIPMCINCFASDFDR